MTRLEAQKKTDEYWKDAIDCIEVYNKLKELDKDGAVWSSKWEPLVDVTFSGYNKPRIYKLNSIGQIFLKGIRK